MHINKYIVLNYSSFHFCHYETHKHLLMIMLDENEFCKINIF